MLEETERRRSGKPVFGSLLLAFAAAVVILFPAVASAQGGADAVRTAAFAELRAGNWQGASDLFDKFLGDHGREPLSLYGSGVARFNLGDLPTAAARIDEAVASLEASKGNPGLLADCLTLSAVISARKGANAEAVSKLRKAVGLAPGHFDANLSLARALYGSGDMAGSIEFFRKASEIRPEDNNARFLLASALENLGEFEKAIPEYRRLVESDPKNASGFLGLGALLIKTEGDDSADGRSSLESAVRLNGSDYESRVTLGKLLVRRKEFEAAITHLSAAAALRPDNPEPHYQLAIAYRRLGRKADAEREMEKVREIHEGRRNAQ